MMGTENNPFLIVWNSSPPLLPRKLTGYPLKNQWLEDDPFPFEKGALFLGVDIHSFSAGVSLIRPFFSRHCFSLLGIKTPVTRAFIGFICTYIYIYIYHSFIFKSMGVRANPVNNGINYQPQLVFMPDVWLPSTPDSPKVVKISRPPFFRGDAMQWNLLP